MNGLRNLLHKKKFLIYGFGKSGKACFKFLNKRNFCKIFDDNLNNIPQKYKKNIINFKQINKVFFDFVVLSPGIDFKNCKISKYLIKNKSKIISELDIFHLSYPKVKKITITGTNGKSTTSKLLFDVLKKNKKDVRLTGNIGYPILLEKNFNNDTIFVIEASSYQLEYSKFFKSNYSMILNLYPNHLERHGNFKKYVGSKFKLIKNQSKQDYAFIENKNKVLNKLIKKNQINSKIKKVNYKKYFNYLKFIKKSYFKNLNNIKNLSFIFEISKILKINFKTVLEATNKFKGLNYRQQIIYNSKKLTVINDSKSTSFSSTKLLLESYENIYWLVGGLAKKGDKLKLNKKYFSKIKAYTYGKDRYFFSRILKNKIKTKVTKNLNESLKLVFRDSKNDKQRKIILFSPSAASFDQFKNFEVRGLYFNKIIKKYIN